MTAATLSEALARLNIPDGAMLSSAVISNRAALIAVSAPAESLTDAAEILMSAVASKVVTVQ